MSSLPMYSYYGNGLYQKVSLEYDENGRVKAIRYGKPERSKAAEAFDQERRQIERQYRWKVNHGGK